MCKDTNIKIWLKYSGKKVLNHVRKIYISEQLNKHRKNIYPTKNINLNFALLRGFCPRPVIYKI